MEKKNFLSLLKQYLEDGMPGVLSNNISIKDVDKLLAITISTILRVISDGDEVRLSPFGIFFPKLIQKDGDLIAIKLGFSAFSKINEDLESRFSKELKVEIGKAKIFSAGGSYRMKNNDGQELFNLTEIARMAGISPPTAYKYAEKYKSLIDVHVVDNGTGKKFLPEVAEIFASIRKRHSPSKPKKNMPPTGCYSLSQVSRITNISMVTLYKYLRRYQTEVYPIIDNDGKRWYTEEMLQNFIRIKERNVDAWSNIQAEDGEKIEQPISENN